MKKYIRNGFITALYYYSKVFRVFYDYRVVSRFQYLKNIIFTFSNSGLFRKFGRGSVISYTCILKNPKYISIGDNTSIADRTVVTAWDFYEGQKYNPIISIGEMTNIGSDCHITAINEIIIGDGVLFGKKVTVTDNSHGMTTNDQLDIKPKKRKLFSKGSVIIEDNVWVGDKVTILPGVKIGKSAIIAANSVVTRNVPENCVVAGNPARIVKQMNIEKANTW
jgi:acetyltransferase-like isoleucine patch superfamily enzyme